MQSVERLKLLLVLTVCDIRGVGPGVWNGWKGQLLRTLYFESELILTGGFSKATRQQKVAGSRDPVDRMLALEAVAKTGDVDAADLLLEAIDDNGADGHIKACLAIASDKADAPRINAPRLWFQLFDDFHRAHFRRAGDGSAGKHGAHNGSLPSFCRIRNR